MDYTKSDKVIVSELENQIRLVNIETGNQIILDGEYKLLWENWEIDRLVQQYQKSSAGDMIDDFVMKRDEKRRISSSSSTNVQFKIKKNNLRTYEESKDTIVIYNTDSSLRENPLLVLSTFGSLIWNQLKKNDNLEDIRKNITKKFGRDDLGAFIIKLIELGFIEGQKSKLVDNKRPNIVSDFEASKVQFLLEQTKIPWYLLWEIGTKCNINCQICYLKDHDNDFLAREAIDKQVEIFSETGIFNITILGGEPLLCKNVFYMIRRLRSKGIFVKMITNGLLLDEKILSDLIDSQLNKIEISLDGIDEDLYEKSRGKGNYKKVIKSLNLLRESGYKNICIVYTVYQENLDDFKKLNKFLLNHGIYECYISVFKKTNNIKRDYFTELTDGGREQLKLMINKWKKENPEIQITLLDECTCGQSSLIVEGNGNVRVCSFSDKAIGNLYENDLSSLWKGFTKCDNADFYKFCKNG